MTKLGSPVWRIAAATGEEPDAVRFYLAEMGLKGYSADDIWTLVKGALNAGMTMLELNDTIGQKV